jgi:predicted nucleotidyltransferase
MRAREGDLIRTKSNVVFDVKGTTHPQGKIIAFPRFIPQEDGTRKSQRGNYGKVYSLSDRFQYLQEHHPDLIVSDPVYGETLCEVPVDQVAEVYHPQDKLAQLREAEKLSALEQKALNLATELKEKSGIPWSAIGISGSIMAGLTTSTSDIDLLVYGVENSQKAYNALKNLRETKSSGFKPYTKEELKALYDFRVKDTQMTFSDFTLVESRKAFQGMYGGVDYFIRFLKDWNENMEQYGDITYQNSGYLKIQASVLNSTDALFTPCTYALETVKVLDGPSLTPITEVTSFRGRFCMQAQESEHIEAQGKAELVINKKTGSKHYRLILGNKLQDYMILLH